MATYRYKKATVCIAILYIITVVCNCAGKTDTEIGYHCQCIPYHVLIYKLMTDFLPGCLFAIVVIE